MPLFDGVAVDPAPDPDGTAGRCLVAESPAGGVWNGAAHPLRGADPFEEVLSVEDLAVAGAVLQPDRRATVAHEASSAGCRPAPRTQLVRPSLSRTRPSHSPPSWIHT